MRRLTLICAVAALLLVCGGVHAGEPLPKPKPAECLVWPGDRIVFFGDDTTEQRLSATYVEAALVTRFPGAKMRFRNAGGSGDTAPGAVQRLSRDVLALKPTLVILGFGMNDGQFQPFKQERLDAFANAERQIIRDLKGRGIRCVILSPTPVDETRSRGAFNYNSTLMQFAHAAEQLAGQEKSPFADQFTPVLRALVNLRKTQEKLPQEQQLVLIPDAVHPSPAGHLLMAHCLLPALHMPGTVSAAEITADGKLIAAEGCEIADIRAGNGGLRFVRRDRCLPMPLHAPALPALRLAPILDELSGFTLKVAGLDAKRQYELAIDGEAGLRADGAAWAKGVNLTAAQGPIRKQCDGVLELIGRKNALYFDRWRKVQLLARSEWIPEDVDRMYRQDKLREMDAAIAALEAEIDRATQPKPHVWTLLPADTPQKESRKDDTKAPEGARKEQP